MRKETTLITQIGSVPSYSADESQWPHVSYNPLTEGRGCFIATAAYGTPLDEKLDVLRWWRDNTLEAHDVGKSLIQIYYKISPPIAGFISKYDDMRAAVRRALNPVVDHIEKRKRIDL